jgi:catechol 2,3-dioxygenase
MTITRDNDVSTAGKAAWHLDPNAQPASSHIGHVHLRVSDLQRSTAFYSDVLGLTITANGLDIGLPIVFLAFGEYHHHLALNALTSAGGARPSPANTGLHHFALAYPDEVALALVVQRIYAHGYPIDSAEDHGATLSVYMSDPDGIGVELYYDRPRKDWFDSKGRPVLKAEPIDPRDLLAKIATGKQ